MTKLKEYVRNRKETANHMPSEEFSYSEVPGKEDVVKVSFFENGKQQSVMLEVFSDEQIGLLNGIKSKVAELRELTPEQFNQMNKKLFADEEM